CTVWRANKQPARANARSQSGSRPVRLTIFGGKPPRSSHSIRSVARSSITSQSPSAYAQSNCSHVVCGSIGFLLQKLRFTGKGNASETAENGRLIPGERADEIAEALLPEKPERLLSLGEGKQRATGILGRENFEEVPVDFL